MPPYLDVSEALLDPTLVDQFVVTRRPEVIDAHGRSTVPAPIVFKNIIGVVTAASPNDLERLDDQDRMGRHLSIVTKFRLQGPSPGFKPDTITWKGDVFIVKSIDPYPQFGDGFVQALVGSIDTQDQPTP